MHPPAVSVGSNHVFSCPPVYHKSPDSDERQYKSRFEQGNLVRLRPYRSAHSKCIFGTSEVRSLSHKLYTHSTHSPPNTRHSSLNTRHSTLNTLRLVLHTLNSTHSFPSTPNTLHSTICNLHSTLSSRTGAPIRREGSGRSRSGTGGGLPASVRSSRHDAHKTVKAIRQSSTGGPIRRGG